jgi:hypothetical protein
MRYTKQSGFSILGIVLFIAIIVVALSIWTFSGSSNNDSKSNHDTLASAIINDGMIIRTAYMQRKINTTSDQYITYMPNVVSTTNILDPVSGMSIPSVSSRAIEPNSGFPKGTWLYTDGYENTEVDGADAPAALIVGINDNVCASINTILYGEKRIVPSNNTLSSVIQGVTVDNPNVAYISGEIDKVDFPRLFGWKRGCLKLQDESNVYFQTMRQ